MAHIVRRGESFCVVYYYTDKDGKRHQKWETFHQEAEAERRKAEVEIGKKKSTLIVPSKITVSELMVDFVNLYGERKWDVSTYSSNLALIANYINPFIGNQPIQSINTRAVDKYIQQLRKTESVASQFRRMADRYLTDQNIERIIKVLRCAFGQAVRWGMIAKNPFSNAILVKTPYHHRDIWDAATIRKALEACRDAQLYVAMNLSFACSMRLGEILGLTWNNVHIEPDDIAQDNAWLYVDKEVYRARRESIKTLGENSVLHIFDSALKKPTATVLVLKKPKTDSSIRKIWIPKTVAYILRHWKACQEKLKVTDHSYENHNLVLAQPNGRPCDDRVIEKKFAQLKKQANLPNVVFHSLRHSSATYKLKYSNGDLKSTQGDTGHASAEMITRIYAHILDEDRKIGAQRFEQQFYANPDLRGIKPPAPETAQPRIDLNTLIRQIERSPELAGALAAALKNSSK